MDGAPRFGPLVAAGLILGAGLGGFVDGILLHQILQWHNMLSAKLPPDTLVRAKANMVWDGYFHAGVWIMTAAGLRLLWKAAGRSDVPRSGRALLGGLFAGWGTFNLVEGVIDHQILALHHVNEYAPTAQRLLWDMGFLAFGAALVAVGATLVRSAKRQIRTPLSPPGERGRG